MAQTPTTTSSTPSPTPPSKSIIENSTGTVIDVCGVGPAINGRWRYYRVEIARAYPNADGNVEAMVADGDPLLAYAQAARTSGAVVDWSIEHRRMPHVPASAPWQNLSWPVDVYVVLIALDGTIAQPYPPGSSATTATASPVVSAAAHRAAARRAIRSLGGGQ